MPKKPSAFELSAQLPTALIEHTGLWPLWNRWYSHEVNWKPRSGCPARGQGPKILRAGSERSVIGTLSVIVVTRALAALLVGFAEMLTNA